MTASSPSRPPVVVWFREDLRLADNPALNGAVASGASVLCLFILDEESPGLRPRGGAHRWWLHGSLASLASDLAARGASLVLRRGPAVQILDQFTAETAATAVYWNHRYGQAEKNVDEAVRAKLEANGIEVETFGAKLLYEPSSIRTQSGAPFRVFTPFWRAAQAGPPPDAPLPPRLAFPVSTRKATASKTGTCSRNTRTGPVVCATHGSRGSKAPGSDSTLSWREACMATRRAATTPGRKRLRAFRLTFPLARSGQGRSGRRSSGPIGPFLRPALPSCAARSAGVNLPGTCSFRTPIWPAAM
jgi:hypothetical protein